MSAENSQERRRQEGKYFIGDASDFERTRGWLMGFFMRGRGVNELLARNDVECAVMKLPTVDPSPPHFHKLATEVTYVLSGRLKLVIEGNKFDLRENQFMVIPPLTVQQNPENDPGTRVFVVKVPSVPDDKFYAEQ